MFITAYRNRACVKSITLKDCNGDAISLASGDAIRVKIGRAGATPRLDLTSDAATANGSSLTFANPTTMYLQPADLNALAAGAYDLEVALVDASQSDAIKLAEQGIFMLHETQQGGVT